MNHAERVREAQRKRRQYLQTIVEAKTLGCIGWIVMVGSGLFTLLFAAGFVISIIMGHDTLGHNIGASVFGLVFTLVPGAIVYLGFQCIGNANKMADDNLYVPSVHEQIGDIPAEEVLLRGSDPPSAAPEELLRAAKKGAETEAQELLRADRRSIL